MGKTALYRKYRSKDFDELIGQDHVSQTLENAVKTGRISHAYLFTGPRGTGKTSAARILARRVNSLEPSDINDEIDIIEIDAASNNGVDEIRDLREKVHIAPNYRTYKVYIIDEVHMLSTAAFNALLKTLEEPPGHVIFVLATTEPHKLPQTIISRTQHFPFRPIDPDTVKQHLKQIASREKITIDNEALKLLAELGEGSVRDSLSMLDQLAGGSAITAETVRTMIGRAHYPQLAKLVEAVLQQKTTEVLAILDELAEGGVAARPLIKQLLEVNRDYIRSHLGDNDMKLYNAQRLFRALSAMPNNPPDPTLSLEAVLLQICFEHRNGGADTHNQRPFHQSTSNRRPRMARKVSNTAKTQTDATDSSPTGVDEAWVKTLSLIKAGNASLYGLLRNVAVKFEANDLCVLTARFQFHFRQLQEPGNFAIIQDTLRQATDSKIRLEIRLARTASIKKSVPQAGKEDQKLIGQVLDILGGEVV